MGCSPAELVSWVPRSLAGASPFDIVSPLQQPAEGGTGWFRQRARCYIFNFQSLMV